MKWLVKVNEEARDIQVQILALERIQFYLPVCWTQVQLPIALIFKTFSRTVTKSKETY